jgi:heme oxygenase
MSSSPVAEDTRFSTTLKKVTWGDHSDAQATDYVHALFRGQLSLEDYAQLVAQHYAIYGALEKAAVVMADDPIAGSFVRPELTRVPALERDLAHLLGPQWQSSISALPATQRYVARIEEVATTSSAAFVAHHYTRYLGDLSGGQAIGAAVTKAYGFGDGPGAQFYVFPEIADGPGFKDHYRTLLDDAAWSEQEHEQVMTEVGTAYRLNTEVLAELGEQAGPPRS